MTSRSPRIMSAPELKISTANDVPAILHDGPDGVPQSGHSVSKERLSLSARDMNDQKDKVNDNDNDEPKWEPTKPKPQKKMEKTEREKRDNEEREEPPSPVSYLLSSKFYPLRQETSIIGVFKAHQ